MAGKVNETEVSAPLLSAVIGLMIIGLQTGACLAIVWLVPRLLLEQWGTWSVAAVVWGILVVLRAAAKGMRAATADDKGKP